MKIELKNKKIILVSPCGWSDFQVSKHHYAKELSKNNQVYFLEYPTFNSTKETSFTEIEPNIYIVNIHLPFPKRIFFHLQSIYSFFLKKKLSNLTKNKQIDLIWSFDNTNRFSLKYFKKNLFKIYHPVDNGNIIHLIENAKSANYVFSCSKDIVKLLEPHSQAKFINHGLSNYFTNLELQAHPNGSLKVGISGNIAVPQIDFETLIKIVNQNPGIDFVFFGKDSIKGDEPKFVIEGVKKLKEMPNCLFKGIVHPSVLANELNNMDAFLLCYDMNRLNRGNNSHKILEYLSIGKVIISVYFNLYANLNLIEMIDDGYKNEELPFLFKKVITNLNTYNSLELKQKRIAFALDNTYDKQLERIEQTITNS